MASSLALKRLLASNLGAKSVAPFRPAAAAGASASRFFSNNAVRDYDSDDDRSLEVDRRGSNVRDVSNCRGLAPNPFYDVFDPFSPRRSLSQLLNMMDRFTDTQPLSSTVGVGSAPRRGWDAKETAEGLYLRLDMPGLGKEDVKVSVEHNTLVIKGEGPKDYEDEDDTRRYTSRIDLPEKIYKTSDIEAEMKNGVLKVAVPKVKEEERSDVLHVKID